MNYCSADNPASHLRMPERTDVRQRFAYAYDQARRLLEFLESPAREMVLTAPCTSMNVAELCGLRWRYVNLDQFAPVDGEAIPPYRAAVRWKLYGMSPEQADSTGVDVDTRTTCTRWGGAVRAADRGPYRSIFTTWLSSSRRRLPRSMVS